MSSTPRNSMVQLWYLVAAIWINFLIMQLWIGSNVYEKSMILSSSSSSLSSSSPSSWLSLFGSDTTTVLSPSSRLLFANGDGTDDDDDENDDFDRKRLIFLLCMGSQARKSKLVERFVWSARNRGRYDGYILLLTDAPPDRYAGLSQRLVVMHPERKDYDTRFKEDMTYKRFKTMVIDYVGKDKRLDPVDLIYYLDVDNMVGNSLSVMFDDLEAKYGITGRHSSPWLRKTPKLWFFANKYRDKSVQGGQFVVDRRSSGPCLAEWRHRIDANITEPKDQPALHKIRGNGRNPGCQIVVMLPKQHIFFPSNKTIPGDVDRLRNGETLEYPALVHIKNSCNTTAQIDTVIEERYVLDIVGNAEYSKKIHVKPD